LRFLGEILPIFTDAVNATCLDFRKIEAQCDLQQRHSGPRCHDQKLLLSRQQSGSLAFFALVNVFVVAASREVLGHVLAEFPGTARLAMVEYASEERRRERLKGISVHGTPRADLGSDVDHFLVAVKGGFSQKSRRRVRFGLELSLGPRVGGFERLSASQVVREPAQRHGTRSAADHELAAVHEVEQRGERLGRGFSQLERGLAGRRLADGAAKQPRGVVALARRHRELSNMHVVRLRLPVRHFDHDLPIRERLPRRKPSTQNRRPAALLLPRLELVQETATAIVAVDASF